MTFLWSGAIQVTVILSIALVALLFLRKRSAALRHSLLSTAIVFSLLSPAFRFVMPAWNWSAALSRASQHTAALAPIRKQISAMISPATRTLTEPQPATQAGTRETASRVIDQAGSLSLELWAGGALVGMIVLLTGLARLARVASSSTPLLTGPWKRLAGLICSEYGLSRGVHLLESRNPSVLVTWGAIRPSVVLPAGSAEWSDDRARIVLRHELAHIRRGDWAMQMIAQTLRILYWFNPLVWIVCRRLRLESECACDDAVLANIEGHEYAEHLLDLARILNRPGQSWSAALAMARPSTIERRFSAMLNPGLNRHPVTPLGLLSIVLCGLALTLSLSAATGPSESAAAAQGRGDRAMSRALFEAAEDGSVSDIESLLRSGADVNAAIMGDGTPLMGAARKGHFEAVRLLLDRAADPNLAVSGDGNPLIVAARRGHIDIVRLLLDHGADPNAPVPGDGNALIMAAREGHANVVTLLLDRGANVDQVVPGDENALISASAQGRLNVVRLLVSRRADVNARVWVEATPLRPFGEWRTPLSEARRQGHQDVVQFLLSVGARE